MRHILTALLLLVAIPACAEPFLAADGAQVPPLKYLVRPAPLYPVASSRLGEHGRVVVWVWIGRDGSVKRVAVRESSGFPRLNAAALKAFDGVRFEPPTTADGMPTEAQAEVPIVFAFERPEPAAASTPSESAGP